MYFAFVNVEENFIFHNVVVLVSQNFSQYVPIMWFRLSCEIFNQIVIGIFSLLYFDGF